MDKIATHQALHLVLFMVALVQPEEVDRIVGEIRSTISLLNPCPSWLVKVARERLQQWMAPIVNAAIRMGESQSVLKKPSLSSSLKSHR